MSFETEWARFGADKQHLGLLAWPERASGPVPAVIVLQEAWGVDEHIEDVTLRFAAAGYVALAPDLFASKGERPSYFTRPRMHALKEFVGTMPASAWSDPKARDEALARLPEPARAEVGESIVKLQTVAMANVDAFVPALVDAAAFLRDQNALSRGARVGAVGYCLGGGLAVRLACADPKLAAAVIYYGMAPNEESLAKITCPVLGFYGSLDERLIGALPGFEASMKKLGKRFEHHVYPGAAHAFANDTRASYHAGATRDAFARTLDLFRRELVEG